MLGVGHNMPVVIIRTWKSDSIQQRVSKSFSISDNQVGLLVRVPSETLRG